jgi:hypothetical protein
MPKAEGVFTFRSFFCGLIFALIISTVCPFCVMRVQFIGMSADFITAGAIFLLFVLGGGVNVILGKIKKSWAFSPQELIVVYIMMIVASAITTWGLMLPLLPTLAGLFYFATPENRWEELLHPHIKEWIAPYDPEACKGFYEGIPKGEPIPWDAWLMPLVSWFCLMLAIYFVMICMMVILRKQWVEKERLLFPLTQLPAEMVRSEEEHPLVRSFFRNRLMWLGFLIPFCIAGWNALRNYHPFFPPINLSTTFLPFRGTVYIKVMLIFPVFGLSYLLSSDLAFSIWFFHILAKVVTGFMNMAGYGLPGQTESFGGASPIFGLQSMGAMCVLVLFGLWTARSHLKDVFRRAFFRKVEIDDSGEALSYRTAVFGMIGGLIFISLWLKMSGFPYFAGMMFLFWAFILFLAFTRIMAEGGVGFAQPQMTPSGFMLQGVGSTSLGPPGLMALGFASTWTSDIRTLVMTSVMNGFKLSDMFHVRKRPLFWAIIAAIGVGFVGSVWMIFRLAYRDGAINAAMGFYFGGTFARFVGDRTVFYLHNPLSLGHCISRWIVLGVGGLVMALLMFMRHRFLAWPLHYLGYPISDGWVASCIWFSVFLGWLIKLFIVKYGGVKLYKAVRPLFLGFILGQVAAASMWMVINFLTGVPVEVGIPIGPP